MLDLLNDCRQFKHEATNFGSFRLPYKGDEYAVIHFPLYDYRATTRGNDQRAGMVVMLTKITDMINEHERQLWVNLLYATVGFIIIEWLLFYGLKLASQRLRFVIKQQTSEIHELKEYYKSLSQIDGLTRLYNHSFFNQRLQQEMQRSQRADTPLCLLMCDTDDFKQINDQYGHLVGDKVIEGISALIRRTVRGSDFAGRYGGEEFIVALPDTRIDNACELANRLIKAIRACRFEVTKGKVSVTSSIGVAAWDGSDSLEVFIKSTDAALYQAKQKGKDRVDVSGRSLFVESQY